MGELLKSKHKITGYFQTKKKVEWVNVPVVDSVSRKFYDDCMVERINEVQCIGKHCASKKLELINRLEAERVKHSNLEKALSSCLFMIEEKNKKIAQLQGKSSASVQSKSLPKTPQRASLQSLPKTPTSPTFVSYEKYFTKQQLVKLRSFGNKMCDDSPFILLVMRSLYDDLNELKGIELKCRIYIGYCASLTSFTISSCKRCFGYRREQKGAT